MNRTVFLIAYIGIALLFANPASPWTVTILAMRLAAYGIGALANLGVLLVILGPIALVVIAALRGKIIDKPWLYWLPLAAVLLNISPWVIGALVKPGSGPNAWDGATMLLATVASLGPLILHIVCITLGAQNRPPEQAAH